MSNQNNKFIKWEKYDIYENFKKEFKKGKIKYSNCVKGEEKTVEIYDIIDT